MHPPVPRTIIRTLVMSATMVLLSLVISPSAPAQSDDGPTSRVLSFSEVETMGDAAYWAYIFRGFAEVVEGHAWGERLRDFLSMNASLAPIEQIESTNARSRGNAFWVTIHPPSTSGLEYYFRDDLKTIFIPKIPIDPHFAGAIFAHELQHAYDRLMSPETEVINRVNNTFVEMAAYVLSRDLLDNFTGGALRETFQQILEEKEYDLRSDIIYEPDKKGRERLERLFGPPSPWETKLRDILYITGLSYEAADNPVERSYATTLLKGFQWLEGAPSTEHAGRDVLADMGEDVLSPIQGQVLSHVVPVHLDSEWTGIVVEGTGADSNRVVRLLGLMPTVPVGAKVGEGEILGQVRKVDRSLKGVDPYLHVELYVDGEREDPDRFLRDRWPDSREAHPTYDASGNDRLRKTLQKAFKAERGRDYKKAAKLFREALPETWFEVTNTDILHYLARSVANLGDYDLAAEYQETMVGLLEKELEYAEGHLPDPELGSIARFMKAYPLRIYLTHMRANLEAYRRDQQTIYVY
ncbi:MAG: hypothetical protein R6W82_00995 [bacterium]